MIHIDHALKSISTATAVLVLYISFAFAAFEYDFHQPIGLLESGTPSTKTQ